MARKLLLLYSFFKKKVGTLIPPLNSIFFCFQSLSGHTTPIECVRFGHTEELVCAGSASGALKIWDLEAARLVRTLTGHKSGIRCIDFHPYGDFLSSGSGDTNLKLWDIRRKGCIFTYKGHSETINCLKFSPDGQWVASGGAEGAVKVKLQKNIKNRKSFKLCKIQTFWPKNYKNEELKK